MILYLILACCNNMILILIEKWNLIGLYELYKYDRFPNWCELCFLGWLSLIQIFSLNLSNIVSWYIVGCIICCSLGQWFISLCFRKIWLILKKYHEGN